MPIIITNKHVIRGSKNGRFVLTKSDSKGNPIHSEHITVQLENFESLWRLHPDPNVDLCAMPVGKIINAANQQGVNFFFICFDKSLIPDKTTLQEFSILEDILMVGYPNGIWDKVNNQPILRKGITATHIKFDYEGRQEFMIDMACFPGSSGSPIVLYKPSGYSDNSGSFVIESPKFKLLGILYAGPQHTAIGEIKIVNIPTSERSSPAAFSRIPNNLGLVIKSSRILELEKLFPPLPQA
ncbi:S1 family peptidase [Catalinimonas niigatensis]|uniref:S1 family peptidase n=1 Tax=Catalinimonas niigatensis TaxID=1397264 RepID=UPI002665E3E7|nr:serine protease [Catalinimonas niigatensis]WPP52998.1 serine protease [Catalinimonas niigatensis]